MSITVLGNISRSYFGRETGWCNPVPRYHRRMRINQVRRALKAGQLQLGMNFGQLRSAEIPRLLAAAGFHWAFVDTEHGNFDLETVNDVCRVAQLAGLCPVVRVADLQYSLVSRALDSGAQGIIFPRMEDPK